MKIKFDLDGVCRDLITPLEFRFGFVARHWSYTYKGKDFWDMVNEIPDIWINASPTEYYPVIKEQKEIEFWTVQKEENKEDTIKWLDKHFPKYKVKFFRDFEHKYETVMKKNIILIDDFPNFPSYEKIILIDRDYNKQAKAIKRIKTPEQLQKVLDKYL